jgi:hypothetical protein
MRKSECGVKYSPESRVPRKSEAEKQHSRWFEDPGKPKQHEVERRQEKVEWRE